MITLKYTFINTCFSKTVGHCGHRRSLQYPLTLFWKHTLFLFAQADLKCAKYLWKILRQFDVCLCSGLFGAHTYEHLCLVELYIFKLYLFTSNIIEYLVVAMLWCKCHIMILGGLPSISPGPIETYTRY